MFQRLVWNNMKVSEWWQNFKVTVIRARCQTCSACDTPLQQSTCLMFCKCSGNCPSLCVWQQRCVRGWRVTAALTKQTVTASVTRFITRLTHPLPRSSTHTHGCVVLAFSVRICCASLSVACLAADDASRNQRHVWQPALDGWHKHWADGVVNVPWAKRLHYRQHVRAPGPLWRSQSLSLQSTTSVRSVLSMLHTRTCE